MQIGQRARVDLVEIAVWHLPGKHALGRLPERAFVMRDPALVEVEASRMPATAMTMIGRRRSTTRRTREVVVGCQSRRAHYRWEPAGSLLGPRARGPKDLGLRAVSYGRTNLTLNTIGAEFSAT